MKKLTMIGIMLLVSMSLTAIGFSGSTTAAGAANLEEQRIEIDQAVTIDLEPIQITASAGFDVPLPSKEWTYDYELAGNLTVSVFKFGASIAGNKAVLLGDIKGFVDIAYDIVGADIDVILSADATKDIFQGAEFSAFINPGPFEFRVGYMLTENGAVDFNTPEALTAGGIYAKAKINY